MVNNDLITIKDYKATIPPGEHHRIMCMTGPNKGKSYFLKGVRVVMGRGDTADIMVKDSKSSREHAEITKYKDRYVITDLGSQNGVVINDLKISQHTLASGDKIIIGKTVFKYDHLVVADRMALAQQDENEEDEIGEGKEGEEEEDNPKPKLSKKTLLILLGVMMVVFFLLDEEPPETSTQKGKNTQAVTDSFTVIEDEEGSNSLTALAKKKVQEEDREKANVIASHIHRGQREYREGNYFRALREFNQALIISPEHANASYYKRKTKQALDNEVAGAFLKATHETDALKFRNAAMTYCSVLRLLEGYTEDQRFKQALEKKYEMEKKLGLDKDEISCMQK